MFNKRKNLFFDRCREYVKLTIDFSLTRNDVLNADEMKNKREHLSLLISSRNEVVQ